MNISRGEEIIYRAYHYLFFPRHKFGSNRAALDAVDIFNFAISRIRADRELCQFHFQKGAR